jgi:hypothetical protein
MPKLMFLLALAALSTFGVVEPAMAQHERIATACKEDIAKYCADKRRGTGEVLTCLKANKDKISQRCKNALQYTGPARGPRSQSA